MSKRKLNQLVNDNLVNGWDDPRMPTIAGLRRRGYTPASIRDFAMRIGITKSDNSIEMGVLENSIREDLDANAPRRMAVLNPLKLVITNYRQDQVEELQVASHPKDESFGKRIVPFSREIWIDREDFREEANRKYKRLVLEGEVRLRGGYVVRADDVIKDTSGTITEIHATYDPDTLGKNPEGRKVRGVIHWVSAKHAIPAEVRLYDRLFSHPTPDADKEVEHWKEHLNPDSLVTLEHAVLEPSLAGAEAGQQFQFEREGYFCKDREISDRLVFNRVVTLRDSWAKIEQGN
jgi:glutaminyl-tRNA synthetase